MTDLWCTVFGTCGGQSTCRELESRPVPVQTAAELPPPLYIVSTVAPGLRSVAVGGELDLATAPLLDAVAEAHRMQPAARGTTAGRFLLDLSGVSFMDASALSALDRIDRLLRRREEDLSVVGPLASGPRRLLLLAVEREWLSPAFRPVRPEDRVAQPARPQGQTRWSGEPSRLVTGVRSFGRSGDR